ncbi:MAG: hypothetical protein ACRBBW_17330 [Cellvibrionaceae bacterium]
MSIAFRSKIPLLSLIAILAGCAGDSTQSQQHSAEKVIESSPTESFRKSDNHLSQTTITLGNRNTLETLYSFPNASDSKETLEQTIEHYLGQRLLRDGITHGSAEVSIDDRGIYHATLKGDGSNLSEYATQIPTFLDNGLLAANAVTELKSQKLWNDEDWRFFLPLGLSIINQRSVQLLHFPPEYSLPDQDYLDSKTSQRWEKLLELNSVPVNEVTLYESILDVAPIAAPASAGSTLSDTYSYFEPYVVKMLPLLLNIDEGSNNALPIVAYGGPVRSWVKSHFNLDSFGVNSFDTVTIENNIQAPILGANHPSYIWYAKENGRAAAFKVMQQDLVSACWQAKMGIEPSADGHKTLSNCKSYWTEKPTSVCINMEIQAFDKSQTEAEALCRDIPEAELKTSLR